MDETNITKRLDDLIKSITTRNQETQEKKTEGPWGWVVAVVLALISLVGISVAMYLANKRAKELADAKTKIEQDKVDQDQKAHEAEKATYLYKRNELLAELKKKELEIQTSEAVLKEAVKAHTERQKKIENLSAWSEINEA